MKIQATFNKISQTIENSKAAQRATQRINDFSAKLAKNPQGDIVDIMKASGKMALEVPRTAFETLVEVITNIIKK